MKIFLPPARKEEEKILKDVMVFIKDYTKVVQL